jgi:hypothetical protein
MLGIDLGLLGGQFGVRRGLGLGSGGGEAIAQREHARLLAQHLQVGADIARGDLGERLQVDIVGKGHAA